MMASSKTAVLAIACFDQLKYTLTNKKEVTFNMNLVVILFDMLLKQ